MKTAIFVSVLFGATSAAAHSGAHLHPHGVGDWLIVALAACVVAGTMVLVRLRGRK